MDINFNLSTESWFVTFLASFLIWFMFGLLMVLWLVNGKIKKEQVLHALFATLIAWMVSESIKVLMPTHRPFELGNMFPLTLTIPRDSGFPSVHASTAFALAISVQKHDKKAGLFFVLFAILVGFGRVLGNVHYSIDVIGGAIVGILSVFVLEKVHGVGILKDNS